MLEIVIPGREYWDEIDETFVSIKEQHLRLEHSLLSIRRWESKWHKNFLGRTDLTEEETMDYIRCMTINAVDPLVYSSLTQANMNSIKAYCDDPMTATTFSGKQKQNREIITAEIVYYWMIALNIPPEYEKWHINQLLTLIKVCNIRNSPSKKKSKGEILAQNKALNDARKARLHTKG